MNHWLVKSETDAFSWDQQVANGVEPWTGVRNHMAKANLMAMKKGDRAFFYHSNVGKEIVGVVEVVRESYPDATAEPGTCSTRPATGIASRWMPTAICRQPAHGAALSASAHAGQTITSWWSPRGLTISSC